MVNKYVGIYFIKSYKLKQFSNKYIGSLFGRNVFFSITRFLFTYFIFTYSHTNTSNTASCLQQWVIKQKLWYVHKTLAKQGQRTSRLHMLKRNGGNKWMSKQNSMKRDMRGLPMPACLQVLPLTTHSDNFWRDAIEIRFASKQKTIHKDFKVHLVRSQLH